MMNEDSAVLICRTCLVRINNLEKAVPINSNAKLFCGDILIRDAIAKCVSELDLDVSNNPVICESCYEALVNVYTFKMKCFQTEERIYSYVEERNLQLGDKIELSDLLCCNDQHKEVAVVSDSESVHIISLSDSDSKSEINITTDHALSNKERQPLYGERQDLVENHIANNCRNKVARFKCDQCAYETSRKHRLTRHIFTHRQRYVCGHCPRNFSNGKVARLHILYKHSFSDRGPPYMCGLQNCQSFFDGKQDFNQHVVKHRDYEPFTCQLCKKVFFDKTQFDKHVNTVHGLC